jgi:hypothetical protein
MTQLGLYTADGGASQARSEGGNVDYTIVNMDELAREGDTYEFEGYLHGGAGVSVILVDMAPGEGPKLHKHPYEEVFHRSGGPRDLYDWLDNPRSDGRTDRDCPGGRLCHEVYAPMIRAKSRSTPRCRHCQLHMSLFC